MRSTLKPSKRPAPAKAPKQVPAIVTTTVVNAGPAANGSVFQQDVLAAIRRMRGSLMGGISPESMGQALAAFERGDLRWAVQAWEFIAERDDIVKIVKPKREEALANRDWQVLMQGGKEKREQAKRQREVVNAFWDSISAVNAYDRNESGGFSMLIRQMLSAVSYKYAAHHIVWRPTAGGLKAEFEFVPLWFFENRTGRLRFCHTGMEYEGRDMPENEWMVTTGHGLMTAASGCYIAKNHCLADWLIFSERCGVPGLLGRTPHAKGSEEGNAMEEAVASINSDYRGVLFGDVDGQSKIETLTFGIGSGTLPMPPMVERMDRRLSALWRGADLSTMSSSAGQGTGASLQEKEQARLEQGDALRLEEVLDRITRLVLEWHFGPEVEQLVYLKIIVPSPEDQNALIKSAEMLAAHGAKVSIASLMERLALTPADDDEEALAPPLDYKSSYSQAFQDGATDGSGFDLMNERPRAPLANDPQLNATIRDETVFMRECTKLLASAQGKDRRRIAAALRRVLKQPDLTLMNALTQFNAALPQYITDDASQAGAWQAILSTAYLNGLGR